jgi:hypothetical protein
LVLRKMSDRIRQNGSKAARASENLASTGIPVIKRYRGSSAVMGPFMAVCRKSDVEKGPWTSALRGLALEVMDRMIIRHASSLVSDPRNGTINAFQGVRKKLRKRKYTQFTEWKNGVMKVFQVAQSKEDILVNDVCADLGQCFNEYYAMLPELSEFRFRRALTSVAEELNETAQTTPVERTICSGQSVPKGKSGPFRVAILTLSDHQGLEWPLLQITVLGNDPGGAHLELRA